MTSSSFSRFSLNDDFSSSSDGGAESEEAVAAAEGDAGVEEVFEDEDGTGVVAGDTFGDMDRK